MEPFEPERFGMRRVRFADGGSSLVVTTLDPAVEQFIRDQKSAQAASEDKQAEALKALSPAGMTRKDWLAASELPETTFDRVRKALLAAERIWKDDRIYRPVND